MLLLTVVMPRKKSILRAASTPGQLYRGISSLGEKFEAEEETIVEKDPPFVQYCKKMHKQFPSFGKNAKLSEAQQQAINFLGWRLTAGDLAPAIKGTFLIGIIPAVIVIFIMLFFGVGIFIGEDFNTADIVGGGILTNSVGSDMAMMMFLLLAVVLIGLIGAIVYYIYSYAVSAAGMEKNKALTYVPEMIGYMIMSMKLVPNLEKAIEFSAKHGRGKVALDFKRLIWDFQIGVYTSISEGLDALAYHWGEYSGELKEALMKIRASVMEPSESHRYQLLDKTMLEVLDSVKGKMEDFARSLNQPAVMLFYLGVLLPLILIIILPVGSAFSGNPLATPLLLFIIYCIVIPVVAFQFANKVVLRRPPTYEPPIIDDDFMGLPKKWHMKLNRGSMDTRIIFVIILVIGFSASFFISSQGLPPKFLLPESDDPYTFSSFQLIPPDPSLEQLLASSGRESDYFGKKVIDLYFIDSLDITTGSYYNELVSEGISQSDAMQRVTREYLIFTSDPKQDPTKYLFFSGIILTLVLAFSFLIYYTNIYKRKAQLGIIKMEDEFKESMYVIASRMGENKPVENALKQARNFLPNLLISQRIFGKTVENIELMGLPLEGAVFDPIYGSMKGIPSKILNTAMRLLVDSVSLGVEVASRTLMSLSLQMENMDKVNKSLKDLVSDVTTTMTTMAIVIGPMVLGITVALQKVVMMTLASVVSDPSIEAAGEAGGIGSGLGVTNININSLFKINVETFQGLASPLVFLIIIAIYVIEIVIIMTYFTTKIQEDNDLLFRVNVARAIPIATIVFVVTALIANAAISMLM